MGVQNNTHELNIFTKGDWVVTLLSNKEIDLGDVVISSIIVQPKEDHDKRVAHLQPGENQSPIRKSYRLSVQGEVEP